MKCGTECQFDQFNYQTDVCRHCGMQNCREINNTTFELKKVDNNNYTIVPSRQIVTPNYHNNFVVDIDGLSDDEYEYTITQDGQTSNLNIKSNSNLDNKTLRLSMKDSTIVDSNGNVVNTTQ